MKFFLRVFMAIHVAFYRLTSGRIGGRFRGFNVFLLTTIGRKSGRTFTTPLGWFAHPEGYILVASNNGLPNHPDWYYNLKGHSQVSVQLLDKVIPITAEILLGEARTQAWQSVIATAPLYAGYEKKTTREIPLLLLRPN
jgi:deazaflavin-dependent oxidoreductase (nitroreductase family)